MADLDDLYAGYNIGTSTDLSALKNDTVFQQAVKTSQGRRPTTQARLSTASSAATGTRTGVLGRNGPGTGFVRAPATMSGRPLTGMGGGEDNRPMTAVKGAGYSSGAGASASMEPGGRSSMETMTVTPEDKVRQMEKRVMELVEDSCHASYNSDSKLALERAKDASAKERALIWHREQAGLIESHNLELTFVVLTNLAYQYECNELYTEALNTYQVVTKNKNFSNAGRLKVNVANIYYKMGQYSKALKFYRMALDQVSSGQNSTKIKIMHNIGTLFVKMGHYPDAITSFEYCMNQKPSFRTGLHLIICYHAMDDTQKQKETFLKLLQDTFDMYDDNKYKDLEDEAASDPQASLVLEAIKNDPMRKLERKLRREAEQCILIASKLISSSSCEAGSDPTDGYNWCVESLKNSQHADLANDLKVNKAVMHLRQKDLKAAVDTLKTFDKVDTRVASHACTNLSFLYFLQRDYEEAERYAEKARDADGYNAFALVNLGNCFFQRADYDKAKEFYICALDNDATCVQALYNLGLVHKRMLLYQEARESFTKLHTIVRSHPQIIYQIANCYELVGDLDQATEWYMQMLSLQPSDPDALLRLGNLFDKKGDKQVAYQYFLDSSRFFPANLEVIDWLGSYYNQNQVSEKAILYLERATLIQPSEVRWHLMIASCYRRAGNYQRALHKYKEIHSKFPENIESLKLLVRICTDLGLNEADEYAVELKRVEKTNELREERFRSGRPSTSYRSGLHGSRSSSAASWEERGTDSRPGSLAPRPLPSRTSATPDSGTSMGGSPQPPVDSSYVDPLGMDPGLTRPRTAAFRAPNDDEIGDDDMTADLLPE